MFLGRKQSFLMAGFRNVGLGSVSERKLSGGSVRYLRALGGGKWLVLGELFQFKKRTAQSSVLLAFKQYMFMLAVGNVFNSEVITHWNKLPKEALASPALKTLG